MKLAFVGTGAIGLPMALCLSGAGHEVTAVDVSDAAVAAARSAGLATARGLGDVPEADAVVVMVATPAQLAALVDGLGRPRSGQLWVLMSTIGPQFAVAQSEALRRLGARVVDAPVTGGVARARRGELLIFASGAADDVSAAMPVLRAMGTVHDVGRALGDGQAMKLVNQHLCAVHIAAAAEALRFARRLGLDPAAVLRLVEHGAAGSWMLSDRGPRMVAEGDVGLTSAIDIFVKDSGLVAAAGAACGAALPLLQTAHAHFSKASSALGLGRCDDSRVIDTWR